MFHGEPDWLTGTAHSPPVVCRDRQVPSGAAYKEATKRRAWGEEKLLRLMEVASQQVTFVNRELEKQKQNGQ